MTDSSRYRKRPVLSLRYRLLLILILLGWVPLALFGGLGYQQASQALVEKEMEQMVALRDLKVREIDTYFQQMEGQARTLSRSPLMMDGLQRLTPAFQALDHGYEHSMLGVGAVDHNDGEALRRALQEELELNLMASLNHYYKRQLLPSLEQQTVASPQGAEEIIPHGHAAHRAQVLYLVDNPFEGGNREWLDDAGDGSVYSQAHRELHPIVRGYRQEFGYYDLFLADLEGNLVYSVTKEVDFGTNLASGPHRDTALGRAWRAAMAEEDGDAVVMEGVEAYLPSLYQPAGFFASPVLDREGQKLGVLLFQFPLDRINTIVQDRQGLGESSEVVLGMRVGGALTFLNELLFSSESPQQKEIKMGEEKALPMQSALNGSVGSGRTKDYQQNEVLAAWAPVTRLGWGLVAKINREQALADATELLQRTLSSLASLTLVIFWVAWRGAASIVNPVGHLVDCFRQVRSGDFSVRAPLSREDELGQLAEAFNRMTEGLHTTTSLKNLNEILASMGEGVLVFGERGKIEHCNPAFSALSGYSFEQVLDSQESALFELLPEGAFQDQEVLMKTADREKISVLLSRSLLTLHGEVSAHSVLVCRDLTERKRMEQQEQDAAFQAGIAEMSASILHNIGNTITGATSQTIKLKGFNKGLSVVEKGLQQGAERMQQLLDKRDSIDSESLFKEIEWGQKVFTSTAKVVKDVSGEEGLSLVESKLGKSISHISEIISLQQSATRGGTHITQFALRGTVLDSMEMIHDSLERYNISFELEIDPSIEHVMLPRNPLIQMLLNLFKNSMESIRLRMKQEPSLKGRIDVYVVPQQDEMFLLTVRDNGAGIDPEVAESLFHFGFTTKSTGSGFGLHASANFASSIGGDIRANSKGINQGAEMRVSLPLVVKKKG